MADTPEEVEVDKANPPYSEIDPSVTSYCPFLDSTSLTPDAVHRCRLSSKKKWYKSPCTKAHYNQCVFAHLKLSLPIVKLKS